MNEASVLFQTEGAVETITLNRAKRMLLSGDPTDGPIAVGWGHAGENQVLGPGDGRPAQRDQRARRTVR